ncbi:beta-ketoacyl-ACP synthase III [Caldithrix abyssi]|uniref:Beta-ketoacyl-[acyl-carrier-protein] synthase III n=1 Tax=Caldithrix abyssi DSM 13497 TaxID=880073 RepID=H1XS99_CALAY|nr:beta-ketoacyl-ACP synthase III [Caldithrix abyssi]APF20205.1 fabH 3-oxoacyl-(acyl-carrier-protein) synthase III [Caldithrix abyssi DSM 13497]EHO40263.1 3-oxoacyl-(acyl-carrier-protein) synthase 3 [Caldithrix abyssi DSM 13497]
MPKAYISAVAHYVPEKVLTNFDLEKMVDTSDEWIRSRTGIRERRILEPGKATSDMAAEAVKKLCENRGIDPLEIEGIVVATVTPDMFFPSTGNLVQEKVGAKNAWSFDVAAACSGFIYALSVGAQYIMAGTHKKIVVVGGDKMSAITNYRDRNTCVLFGDAAAAVLLEPTEDEDKGIIDFMLFSDGSGADYLKMKAGGSLFPASLETVVNDWHYIYQDGKTVFKFAVTKMAEVSVHILEKNGFTGKDLTLFIPHQANLRIIDAAVKRLGIDYDKVMINIDKYGNTTAATIPLALSEAYLQGKLDVGDLVVFATFGGGFTWASTLLRWGIPKPEKPISE